MKVLFLSIVYFIFSISCSAAILTSASGGIIDYLPTKGQVIKKGELLLRLTEPTINYEMAKTELDIKLAEHDLIDKKSDLARFDKLHNSKIVSAAKYEDMIINYYIARIKLEKLKIKLKELKTENNHLAISSPYDCVVTEVFLMPHSGVSRGTSILTAKRVVDPEKDKTTSNI
ncbi:MAG TPA: hypothetical protein QF753_14190 [Victivallales bacterium]|nr:hypothetical protein [Victivallales bacterium]